MTAMICPASSLWMGDVAPEMDENFIKGAFAQVGEKVMRVKIMNGRNNQGGHLAKYCFVEFVDYESAQRALFRLNGTFIPGTPGRRFKLNRSSKDQTSAASDFSIFVGNLSGDVNDMNLCSFFKRVYPSVHGAKVILDQAGNSRCFGFVRFSKESEQQRALKEMQNAVGLGARPLKVNSALSKKPDFYAFNNMQDPEPMDNYNNSYHQQCDSYEPYMAEQQMEYHSRASQLPSSPNLGQGIPQRDESVQAMEIYSFDQNPQMDDTSEAEDDAETLEDPGLEINISKENREFIDSSEAFFTALEMSRWQPLDNILSEIPDEQRS